MEDRGIIDLYNARSEDAIRETDAKYGGMCRGIAGAILTLREDMEEAVSDAYLGLWNAIPPRVPRSLGAFAARVTRNVSLKKYDYITARRRNPACVQSLEELGDCVSGGLTPEAELEDRRLREALESFLRDLTPEKRYVFLRRYWYFDPIDRIAERTGFSASKVTSMLHQMRLRLRQRLIEEDIDI